LEVIRSLGGSPSLLLSRFWFWCWEDVVLLWFVISATLMCLITLIDYSRC
jgi:hypothetical protein